VADFSGLYDAIVAGNSREAKKTVEKALQENADAADLIATYMIPAMDEVGRRFDAEEYFYTELIVAGRAMKAAFEPLRPLLAASDAHRLGRVVTGTVEGDLHDIGKNLVGAMLEGAGFEVIDLGVDVSPAAFVANVKELRPDILALSALLTITAPAMRSTIATLELEGVRSSVKVMVGGAAITKSFAREIGADGYGRDATAAVSMARSLVGVPSPPRTALGND
jgi:5-methyltetrahydrofolate--homocysteine methyltransferase